MHITSTRAIYLNLRKHGVPVRVALRILHDLAPPDPVRQLDHRPGSAAFVASVAHYLRALGTPEAGAVKHDVRRFAWIVTKR